MIHVLITVKPSTRYPGKNARLAGYTVAWLAWEILHTEEAVKVYTVGARQELPRDLPPGWQHIECSTGSHRGDIEHAEERIMTAPGDVMILAQLTQPMRRRGLLADVAEMARLHGCAVTGCQSRREDWRALTDTGAWAAHKGGRTVLHDGALYGWQPGQVGKIFDAAAEHGVVVNYAGQPVDIDTPGDEPPALSAHFAAVLFQDYGLNP